VRKADLVVGDAGFLNGDGSMWQVGEEPTCGRGQPGTLRWICIKPGERTTFLQVERLDSEIGKEMFTG
jgi:hypothetical protein